jgi:hypothetical protein
MAKKGTMAPKLSTSARAPTSIRPNKSASCVRRRGGRLAIKARRLDDKGGIVGDGLNVFGMM